MYGAWFMQPFRQSDVLLPLLSEGSCVGEVEDFSRLSGHKVVLGDFCLICDKVPD